MGTNSTRRWLVNAKTSCCRLLVMVILASQAACAMEQAVLTMVWEKELLRDGGGEWDWKVPRDAEGNTFAEGPRGIAVDKQGSIFVSDSFNERILVFTADGERKMIIHLDNDICFPRELYTDANDNLFVFASGRRSGKCVEVLLSPGASGYRGTTLDADDYTLGPKARFQEHCEKQVIPLGTGTVLTAAVEVDGEFKYQMLDQHGRPAGFAPSIYRDKRGRFYTILPQGQLQVFNEDGECASEVNTLGFARLIPYRGYIYIYILRINCLCLLKTAQLKKK